MITKQIGEQLNYYECLQLLDKAAEYGIIKRAGDDLLMMYCETEFGADWFPIPMTACANKLASDINGQTYYREALKRKGIELLHFCDLKSLLCAMG